MRLSLTKSRKAQLDNLFPLVYALVAIGIALTVGFLIFAEAQDQVESIEGVNSTGQNSSGERPSAAWNGTRDVVTATSQIPGWLSIIVITVIGTILLGLVSLFRRR